MSHLMSSQKTGNPYRRIHRLEAKRRGFAWSQGVIVLSATLAAPLAEPAFLHFASSSKLNQGLPGLVFRLQALIAALMALHTYSALIRGPDRSKLDPHPIWPAVLLRAIAYRGFMATLSWPLSIWLLSWPLCRHGHHIEFFWLAAPIFSAWLGMMGFGYMMGLAAVWASRSNAVAPLLDMMRGQNPREQAAFIYAPGMALFIMGLTFIASANTIEGAIGGDSLSAILIFTPLLPGIIGWALALRLAPRQYVPASAVLAEIDARWSAIDVQEDAHHVYLEWLSGNNSYRLKAFRQGWRALRTWPLGAGLLGFLGLISAWNHDFDTAVMISAFGVVAVSAIPFQMAKGDPTWLNKTLGINENALGFARAWVSFCYAQGAVLPVALMVAFQGGGGMTLVYLSALAGVSSLLSAFLVKRFRRMGAVVYIPLALVLWALVGRM